MGRGSRRESVPLAELRCVVQTLLVRTLLAVVLALAVAACSRPAGPPSLTKLVGDTATLSSFDALVSATGLNLDTATASGEFTVFAPSNALLDAYAQLYGFANAADLLDAVDALSATELQALRHFVLAHVVTYAPGVMTRAFLTGEVEPDGWTLENLRQPSGGQIFTRLQRVPPLSLFSVTPSVAIITPGELVAAFRGAASDTTYEATVYGISFVAADVRFRNGVVHVINGTAEVLADK